MARGIKKPQVGQTYKWEDPTDALFEVVTLTSFKRVGVNVWIFEGLNHATQKLQPVAFSRSHGATNWKLVA
jgi:hypothetical protein